ncbi:MAG: tetratricopeptide repeat protein [Gammaproteobacteria bacterium]
MTHLKKAIQTISVATICVLSIACSSVQHTEMSRANPDQRLDEMMGMYELAQGVGDGCHEIWTANNATVDCQRILNEIERLYVEFPNHERIVFSNAVINYEMGKRENAQWLLDQLELFQRANPEAAMLRAEIAIKEGNLKFADSLVERQILLLPSNSGLRELKASIAYLKKDYDTAKQSLSVAGRLGAPAWRLAYHHGLVSEAQLNWGSACQFYQSSIDQKSDFNSALARLIGLIDKADCASAVAYIQ